MHQELERIRQKQLKNAEQRFEQECRALIIALRELPNPLTFRRILESQLVGSSGMPFGGVMDDPEALSQLEPKLNAYIHMGWLGEICRERPPIAFGLSDEFEVTLAAHKVKARAVKKQNTSPGTTTIVVRETQYGLKVRYGKATTDLTDSQEILFATLYDAHQRGAVVSHVDFKNVCVQSLRNTISDLREEFRKLGLAPDLLKKGIRTFHGQGYGLDTNVLKVVWRKGPYRQRNTIGCNSL